MLEWGPQNKEPKNVEGILLEHEDPDSRAKKQIKERERERARHVYIYIHTYIYISRYTYIYIYIYVFLSYSYSVLGVPMLASPVHSLQYWRLRVLTTDLETVLVM